MKPTKKKKKATLTMRIPKRIKKKWEAAAKAEGRTLSGWLRHVLSEKIGYRGDIDDGAHAPE